MDFKTYLNTDFIQALQDLLDSPNIKAEIAKFDKLGGLDPACFLELCCKYLREGRTISSFVGGPISTLLIADLRKLHLDVACQSEDVMYEIDARFEKYFADDAEFMRKYHDWEEEAPVSIAYDVALLEYKKDHPDAYFGGQESDPSGKLQFATGKLYKICERILSEKFKA